jgi:hypothetical protein
MSNFNLAENANIVSAFGPALASGAAVGWVSLKNYQRATVVIHALNTTTVTGSVVTLVQATAIAGTGAKAIAFTTAKRNIDTALGNAMVDFAVTGNSFTLDATNAKSLQYQIDIDPATMLDVNGGFDVFRVNLATSVAQIISAQYVLWLPRYSTSPSAIVD